uniref:Cytochrome c oxidase subunit 7C, mitochondrial n=1 Tax=Prolemur simus TaxID=1328070 RepID=A0A8C8ZDG5_PROSS
ILGQSLRRFTTSMTQKSHYEDPGKNLPFLAGNKWSLLTMMTLYFRYGFSAPLFIVRRHLFKK